mgnify:CR=1 FL=1
MRKWIGRFTVIRQRLHDSWMELLAPVGVGDPGFLTALADLKFGRAPIAMLKPEDATDNWHDRRNNHHQIYLPIGGNLLALIFICLADLHELQRARITGILTLKGTDCSGVHL